MAKKDYFGKSGEGNDSEGQMRMRNQLPINAPGTNHGVRPRNSVSNMGPRGKGRMRVKGT